MNEQPVSQKRLLCIFSMIVNSLTFLFGVIGNGLVIFITGFRMKKTVNTIWFLNLAVADFTFTFFLPLNIVHLALNFHWPFGEAMCKFCSTMVLVNLHASVYFLMIISVDCCISVRCPVWSRNHRTLRLASFVALGVWILALALSSPNLQFRKTMRTGDVVWCYREFSSDMEQAKILHRAMVISQFILTFAAPFSVITVCYGVIVLQLRRDRLTPSSKPFKVITAVIVAFFICWFPYHVFSFLKVQAHEDPSLYPILTAGALLSSGLAFVNSCLNPILYIFMGRGIRQRLKCSILSIFENAFSEVSQSTKQEKIIDVGHHEMNISRLETFPPTP
ncbi:PREDICTED: chemokine-like receptor 1 [Gekko japonicus]|uniref:Chemokine-like receptor 1 n=1 Tax=Gekko japonicus TaxID=146911 RepID=A0ABM1LBJ4_GEKJA|nr:PREDICTED: chemokine-like receptor 1 [Gekko japonicus]